MAETPLPDIRRAIRDYLVETLLSGDGRGFTDDLDLQASSLLDSFTTLELTRFLEETFGITLGPEQVHADSFRSVETLADTVRSALRGDG